ncbi:MAG: putative Ig domain-containing protein, partial [Solirubrobacteraceae bacterium]
MSEGRSCCYRVVVGVLLAVAFVLLGLAGRAFGAGSSPTWVQLGPAASPPAEFDAAAAYDGATGQFVLFGGQIPGQALANDTWVWNGSVWSEVFSATSPPPSFGGRMAYDAATKQLILFGGNIFENDTSLLSNETWEWTGSDWVQLDPVTSPPPLSEQAMAYDPATGHVLMFGGLGGTPQTGFSATNGTWAWNGSNWQQLNPSTVPSVRREAAIGWDAATSQLIMYGGQGVAAELGDTWIWNGNNWTQETPKTNPGPLAYAPLVYDSTTGQMLLIAGSASSGAALSTVWDWSGSNWIEQTPSTVLTPARFSPVAGYDTSTAQLLLFGGDSDVASFLNDTWVWTPLAVGTQTLPPAAVGLRYSTAVQAIAGTPPYTWSVSSGSLPSGLSLSPSGVISGSAQTTGSSTFTLAVEDSTGTTATRSLTLTVNPTPAAAVWVSSNSAVDAFALNASGNANPTVTLGGALTQLDGVGGLVLDTTGEVYASNIDTPSVTVYASGASGNAAPVRTIEGAATGLVDPAGITLDPSGRLYVTNPPAGTVTVYPAGANGDQAPVQTIGGSNTGLRDPVAVTVDAAGHIWVADYANSSLSEFAAGANGNVAPLATINGPTTGLDYPDGLTQDSNGNLLVANVYGESVTEYANAPPYGSEFSKLTISGQASQLDFPESLDVDGKNDVYVANELAGVNVYAPGATLPSAVISGSNTGLEHPHALAVAPPMTIAARSLPAAALGRRYSAGLFALLGAPPLRWRIVGGRLPAGLGLASSGRISGVPVRLGRGAFTVQVSGSSKVVLSQKQTLT